MMLPQWRNSNDYPHDLIQWRNTEYYPLILPVSLLYLEVWTIKKWLWGTVYGKRRLNCWWMRKANLRGMDTCYSFCHFFVFLKGSQLLWLPVSFLACLVPIEKKSAQKRKIFLPREQIISCSKTLTDKGGKNLFG